MRYVIENNNGSKMIMNIVSSMPQLPEGWVVLGLLDELPEVAAEIEAKVSVAQAASNARQLLASTDFKVLRHIREKALAITTSLTEEEYLVLEQARQNAVEIIRTSENT